MSCQYDKCKYKGKPDYCGKHIKIIDKLNNPDKYCSRKGCRGIRKDGYKRCEKCVESSKRSDAKKRAKKIGKNECRRCGKIIGNFKTKSGKKPTLCEHHYKLQCKAEDKRSERDRKKQYKEYDEKRKNDKNRIEWKKQYNRTLKAKLIYYKNKSNRYKNKKWVLTDEYAYYLFQSQCYYCGKKPEKSKIGMGLIELRMILII